MKKKAPVKPPSFRPIINRGNLTELREWVESGKSLYDPKARNHRRSRSMLEHVTEVGFYSMVELLLEIGKWEEEDLGYALDHAARDERKDLVELLLDSGAPWQWAEADDIIMSMDDQLIRRFLGLGMSLSENDAFFSALDSKRARPLLRIYKSYRDEYPELEDQIAKALTSSVREKRLWWSIMLLWAGADPTRKVPYELRGELDEHSCETTAVEEAYNHGDLEYIEKLKIDRAGIDIATLLRNISFKHDTEMFRKILLRAKPEDLNATEGHSCTALEYLVNSEFCNYSWRSSRETEQKEQLECIRLLLDAGAQWNPDRDDFRYVRRGLGSYEGTYVVQVIRLLIYTPDAAPFEKVWELCRTPKMKHLIYLADDHLWSEINEMAVEHGLKGSTKRSSRSHASL